MAITAAEVNKLRQQTGAGMMDCKKALEESNGDFEKAVDFFRKKGAKVAANRADRDAKEGVVLAKVSGKNGVLVSVNCETDFVGRTDDFKALAKEIALHIAAANPLYLHENEVPAEVVEKEKEIYKEQMKDKPDDVVEKILEGKIAKYYEEACLMEQPFVKNPDQKVKDIIGQATAKMGENIQIRRLARFVLGS